MEFFKISWTYFKLTWKRCSTVGFESKQCLVCNWFGRCVQNGSKRISTFSRNTTKFPYGEISIRRIGFYGEISVQRNIRTTKFPAEKYPNGEISLRRNFPTAKFPYGEISYGEISYSEFSGHERARAVLQTQPSLIIVT